MIGVTEFIAVLVLREATDNKPVKVEAQLVGSGISALGWP